MKLLKIKNCYSCPFLESDNERDKYLCTYQRCFCAISSLLADKESKTTPNICLLNDFNNNDVRIDLHSETYYISIDERGIVLEGVDPICYLEESDIIILCGFNHLQIEKWIEKNV